MKKSVFLVFIMLLAMGGFLTARDVVGHISTDSAVAQYGVMSKPIMTAAMPKVNVPSVLIKYPEEVLEFFENEGIDRDNLCDRFASAEFTEKICAICEGQDSEFCTIMCRLVAQFSNPQYEAYIVQVGTLYWTIYT